jgi:hypothetical protein
VDSAERREMTQSNQTIAEQIVAKSREQYKLSLVRHMGEAVGVKPQGSTFYSKAFCVKCLADRPRSGGVMQSGLFICRGCR